MPYGDEYRYYQLLNLDGYPSFSVVSSNIEVSYLHGVNSLILK